jgi:membrane-associated phospholipid phosphatase
MVTLVKAHLFKALLVRALLVKALLWKALYAVTDLGDSAVLLPLAVAVLCWLALRSSRLAAWWALAVALDVGLTAIAKIYFFGCPPVPDMRSPSGHTALSVLVYGALAMVAALSGEAPTRMAAVAAGAGLIMTIAVSRLLLSIHSLPEVVFGFGIGALSLALFAATYVRSPQAKVWPILIVAGLLVSLLHGQQLHAEELLHRITGLLRIKCG